MTTKSVTTKKAGSAGRKSTTAEEQPKKGKKAKGHEGKAGHKEKVVRDSFTMPQGDYAKIAELKQVCQEAGLHVKKSELLRAGLHALSKLTGAQLKRTMSQMERVKTGRPRKPSA